ncbi:sugar phosphate isomerase/epimerase family protein [Tuwongella immobilis]|uniref:Xylose isomerase-like TIM barrel domain-containing protein n=1 Tax=Tuwongella immobilis TaxID=692036 RepID=A0A6C2YIV9_9BACT|nr:TIM barrel protein [Tuwongella immobilis]VIP01488.1 Sugar phosphate isomerase/epimerase OS=Singulisphaera acidiphila (strain ATCC BAA-1392 / DSM 18658 / VKM B-2454 / MOB10) GN=Sinac_7331 PE=4 SV=1: AP_endonuc_2 [Tuwongella immobilis]VTR98556.1 Sugar phosphate isomerase/epimerase OS=Singulisphaera acidiphila (strain ATCC BAA-1392 / DSM 18658 / VKM B-2454 / MOB10) GN=Sinac_7331 PE=4 SV=1: AP_endonuc_2 [Tuwongella immobilis]
MFVACSTLCYGKVPLSAALQRIRELRFQKVDLAIHESGHHLKPSEVAADMPRVVQHLRTFNITIAALHLELAGDIATQRLHLQACARLARVMTVPVMTVLASPLGSDFAAEVVRLQEWNRIVAAEGVILSVETNSNTLTADPLGAIELCKRVPGLGITLDPSHYIQGPHRTDDFDHLVRFVQHVQLRDTGKKDGQFQVRIGQGVIEYGKLINTLERERYQRTLTVDIRDSGESSFSVEPEVRTLKYLLESLL